MRRIAQPKNRNKYGNTKVEFDGIKFDSKREMERYLLLLEAQKKGLISGLEVHKRYELLPAVKETYIEHLKTKDREKERTLQLAVTYTCDFFYIKDGEEVVEDIKISEYLLPKEYVLKEKMMFYFYRIKIKRVYKPNEPI
jgi:hypothetical protein